MTDDAARSPQPRKERGRKFPGLLFGSAVAVGIVAMWEGGMNADGSSVAYADRLAGGLPTVCGGLTPHITSTPIVVGERWPREKCFNEMRTALITVQSTLERCFTRQPAQHVFDAATSHAWNNGSSATCGSLAMRAWNAGEWGLGCKRLAFSDSGRPVWSYVKDGKGHKFVRGLALRRQSEYHLCLTGVLKR